MARTRNRQSMRSMFVLAIMGAVVIAACGFDEEPTTDPVEEGIAPDDESADQASPDQAVDALNCSIVEFCGTGVRLPTRCRQVGCSVGDAKAECLREVVQVCGAKTCPLIFDPLLGPPVDLCISFP